MSCFRTVNKSMAGVPFFNFFIVNVGQISEEPIESNSRVSDVKMPSILSIGKRFLMITYKPLKTVML